MTIEELIAEVEYRGQPLSDADIVVFEQEIGARLPADYRAFLQICNGDWLGGKFWADSEFACEEIGLHHVQGLRDDKDHFNLRSALRVYHDPCEPRMPRELLAIADDPFGNEICVCVAPEHFGTIWFWNHELPPGPEGWDASLASAENVTMIFSNFTKLVGALRVVDDEEVV